MIGRALKHYQITEFLGKGGMGEVFTARDRKLDRDVALKVLSAELTGDADRRRRFLQEARAAARITHPSIAQVYDVDEADGITFIAMELVIGKNVRALIRDKELDLLGAVDVAIQVADGLAKAHKAGIIHRDIKPANVIISPDGHAKILDFGLAKLLDQDSQSSDGTGLAEMETVSQTRIGTVMGTAAYMSPEQAKGLKVDHRTDLFSLGVMLYEMAGWRLPFQRDTPMDTLHAIAFDESPPLNSVKRNIPPDLQRIVSRCLRKRPEDRYPDAASLAQELRILKRETESGRAAGVPLLNRIQSVIDPLLHRTPREYLPFVVGLGVVATIVYLLLRDAGLGGSIFFLFVCLLIYRHVRNTPHRVLERFVRTTARIPEVRLIAFHDGAGIVVVDRAVAQLYKRINDAVHRCNQKLFFGKPMHVAVREGISSEELKEILSRPGVQYVRDDVTEIENEPDQREPCGS